MVTLRLVEVLVIMVVEVLVIQVAITRVVIGVALNLTTDRGGYQGRGAHQGRGSAQTEGQQAAATQAVHAANPRGVFRNKSDPRGGYGTARGTARGGRSGGRYHPYQKQDPVPKRYRDNVAIVTKEEEANVS